MHMLRMAYEWTERRVKDVKKRNLAKNVYHLSMAGIELGSFEFKSKSSNRWAVEATDESWHIIVESVLLPITILYKETDRKKLEGTI